jgi:hypothetical protein
MKTARIRAKILALVLAALLTAALMPPARAVEYGAEVNPDEKTYEQKFSDVPRDHWAFTFIAELTERGTINGYPDGKFRPGNTVTRAEFTKIMSLAAGMPPARTDTVTFSDVPTSHWVHPYLESTKDFMTGYKVGGQYLFRPDSAALREDMAVALVKLKGYDVRFADLAMLKAMFKDYETISETVRPYVALAVENGLVSGYPDETFRAQNSITRAEASALLWRAFQYGSDNKVTDIGGGDAAVAGGPADTDGGGVDDAETTSSPTSLPTPTPTPEPTPESEKPLAVDTVLAARSVSMPVIDDNNNLYYVDTEANAVIKLNVYEKEPVTLLSLSELDVDNEESALYGFQVDYLYHDDYADELLIHGAYKNVNPSGLSRGRTFAINSGGREERVDYGYFASLGNGGYLTESNLCTNNFDYVVSNVEWTDGAFYYLFRPTKKNAIYLYRYDFASPKQVTDTPLMDIFYAELAFYNDSAFIKNQTVYLFSGTGAKKSTLILTNFKGKILGEYKESDASVNDRAKFDMFMMTDGNMFVTQRNDIVYYDSAVRAFRIITIKM